MIRISIRGKSKRDDNEKNKRRCWFEKITKQKSTQEPKEQPALNILNTGCGFITSETFHCCAVKLDDTSLWVLSALIPMISLYRYKKNPSEVVWQSDSPCVFSSSICSSFRSSWSVRRDADSRAALASSRLSWQREEHGQISNLSDELQPLQLLECLLWSVAGYLKGRRLVFQPVSFPFPLLLLLPEPLQLGWVHGFFLWDDRRQSNKSKTGDTAKKTKKPTHFNT